MAVEAPGGAKVYQIRKVEELGGAREQPLPQLTMMRYCSALATVFARRRVCARLQRGGWPGAAFPKADLQIPRTHIDRRFDAEAIEIRLQPLVGAFAADLVKICKESPVAVQLAGVRQRADHILAVDRMNEHPFAVGHLAAVNQVGHESNRTHLPHQR